MSESINLDHLHPCARCRRMLIDYRQQLCQDCSDLAALRAFANAVITLTFHSPKDQFDVVLDLAREAGLMEGCEFTKRLTG